MREIWALLLADASTSRRCRGHTRVPSVIRSELRACTLLAIVVGAFCAGSAHAQRRPPPAGRQTPFEHFVPASARFFVTIRELREMDAALHRTHAWGLLPMIAGSGWQEHQTFDLRAAVTSLVDPNRSIDVDELMQAEVGIVAPSWTQLGNAVWLARPSDEEALDRWFPRRRRRGRFRPGKPQSFHMRSGMDVCIRDDVAAMTRRTSRGSPLRDVRRLMSGQSDDSLDRSEIYQELVSYLPGRHLAIAYVSSDSASGKAGAEDSGVWPVLDRTAIGLYEREGRIDLAIRGSRAIPQDQTALAPHAVTHLMRFPQTTLFTLGTTIDFDRVHAAAISAPSRSVWRRYLAILTGLARHATARSGGGTSLGPHVLLAWGQDLSERGSAPQIALMVECQAAQALRGEVSRIAGNLVKLAGRTGGLAPEAIPAIEQKMHLGTLIEHVSLEPYAAESTSPMASLVAGTDPAWAAWRNWFIIALTRDHLERILDAQNGLIPTLTAVRDVRELQHEEAARSVIALAQPALAADVMDRWLKDYEAGSPSLLAPSWWANPLGVIQTGQVLLGVVLRSHREPGVVVVADVPAQSAASGHLQAGDRILGVDGHVLSLEAANTDLRTRLTQISTQSRTTLRVQRGDRMLDVVVPLNTDRGPAPRRGVRPADAVRELASLGQALRLATFSVHIAGESRYSARLSLRFSAESPPHAAHP